MDARSYFNEIILNEPVFNEGEGLACRAELKRRVKPSNLAFNRPEHPLGDKVFTKLLPDMCERVTAGWWVREGKEADFRIWVLRNATTILLYPAAWHSTMTELEMALRKSSQVGMTPEEYIAQGRN